MLRAYQTAAVDAAERDLGVVRSTLINFATGVGKTTTFTESVRRASKSGIKSFVTAHRRELIDQAAKRMRQEGLRVGVERGSKHCAGRLAELDVVVASVQTMSRRLAEYPANTFGLVVIDECHHATSASYRRITDHFAVARILGVTATTQRADGVPLGTIFERCSAQYGIKEAIDAGMLVPIYGLRVEVPGMDLSKVRQYGAHTSSPTAPVRERAPGTAPAGRPVSHLAVDLDQKDLGAAVIAPEAVEGVVVPLLALAEARRTVVFAVDRKHARAIAASLNAKRADCARWVDGSMDQDERAAALEDFAAGRYQFIVNCMLLTEGWDCPSVECVAMARPTQSIALYVQAVGRALRLHPGKTNALLLDFVGVSCRFPLVGPEDALGDALAAPIVKVNTGKPVAEPAVAEEVQDAPTTTTKSTVAPVATPEYVPPANAAPVSFTQRAVEVLSGAAQAVASAGRKVGRAGRATGRTVRRGAKAVSNATPSWIKSIGRALFG